MKMLKRKIFPTAMLSLVFSFGCSNSDNMSANASLPSGFELVSEDRVSHGSVFKAKEINTGCFFVLGVSRGNSATTVSIEQIYVEKDGVTVPYCVE